MNPVRSSLLLFLVSALPFGLTACDRSTNAEQRGADKKRDTKKETKSANRKPSAGPNESAAKLPRTTTQPARILAWETTPLYAKVTGYVETMHVDIGDEITDVKQPLVTLYIPEMLDEERQKLALEKQAGAELKQAKAAVKLAESRKKTADANVSEAVAGLGRFLAAKKRWDSELERLTNLAKDGSVSQKLVDETQFEKDSADAAIEEVKAKVQSAKAAQSEAASAIKQAEADENAADARLKVAVANRTYTQTMLQYAQIKSPFVGVVVARNADTGHFVQPGDAAKSKPLLVVARIEKLRVVVEVPEADAPFVKKGNDATIRVPALGKQGVAPGKVARTSFALNPRNRTLRVEIDVPNKDALLRPGMYAEATISLQPSP